MAVEVGVEAPGASLRPHSLADLLLPVALPLALIVVILAADLIEGPKTAYVGVLTAIPMLAAVFGTVRETAVVGLVTWLAAAGFGLLASDGNVNAQYVRLVFIALSSVVAVWAARRRGQQQRRTVEWERQQVLLEQMRREASTDLLTGLRNRRGVTADLEDLERTTPWTIAIVDCDDFKAVNDVLGHEAGDEYLQALGTRLSRALADGDVVGRWGGDEFLIALPLTPSQARPVLDRVHQQVSRDVVVTAHGTVRMSLTLGAAEWRPTQTFGHALREADQALYAGKHLGSNQVIVAGVRD